MKPLVTWIGVILSLCVTGLVVSDALSWERWVSLSRVAAQPTLAQERRPAASPVLQSRFARPVPRGWTAPSLAGARDRPDEAWRPRLAQLGLPVAAQASRLWVELAGDAGSSMEFDARARLGPPPLAASVRRVFASLPVPAVAAPLPAQSVGSLERACESQAIPLPKVRLVKDVLDAMPDKCDERLFGTWYCGIHCGGWSCDPTNGIVTLRRSIDPDGYERIHRRLTFYYSGDSFHSEWKVARKWGASVSNAPPEKGRLVFASCNGKTDAGYGRLAVNLKNPNGSDRHLYIYRVDRANRTLWIQYFSVRWEGDKMHKKSYGLRECRRELAE